MVITTSSGGVELMHVKNQTTCKKDKAYARSTTSVANHHGNGRGIASVGLVLLQHTRLAEALLVDEQQALLVDKQAAPDTSGSSVILRCRGPPPPAETQSA